ncbi:MAG: hypothetical protein HUK03_00670 [Bacteroidaceae bacterium]|nr:hypothetical protein [Bacteroidaceae bacterium]
MSNNYHRDIVDILLEAGGNGLKVRNIASSIYNRRADLVTNDVVYDEIRRTISPYLWRSVKGKHSIFTRTAYGTYAIKIPFALQMDLFLDTLREEEEDAPTEKAAASNIKQLELF